MRRSIGVRKVEGKIYGEGTADLLKRIDDALRLNFPDASWSNPADPMKVTTVIHTVLAAASEATEQNPKCETFIRAEGAEGRRTYTASWESGPYEWAIPASFIVMEATGRLCEPYYSFDLQLYDIE